MRRNIRDRDRMNIAVRFFAEIGGVCLSGKPIPVAGENTFGAGAFKCNTEAAYAAEEIDKTELSADTISICDVWDVLFPRLAIASDGWGLDPLRS